MFPMARQGAKLPLLRIVCEGVHDLILTIGTGHRNIAELQEAAEDIAPAVHG